MLPRFSLLSLVLLLAPLLPFSASAEPSPVETEPLLRVEGKLEDSDPTLSEDKTRYDEYQFTGQAGQTITIVLESVEFDPYVLLKNPAGETIQQNDDYADDNRNSVITFTLPESGTYTIVANAYSAESRGSYKLTVLVGNEPVFLAAEEQILALKQTLNEYRAQGDRKNEAKTLNRIGIVYYRQEQYAQAIEYFDQALTLYQQTESVQDARQVLVNLADAYDELEQFDQAEKFYKQAIEVAQQSDNSSAEISTLYSLGVMYMGKGQTLNLRGVNVESIPAFEQAIEVFQQVQRLAQSAGNTETEQDSIGLLIANRRSIGYALKDNQMYPEAIIYFQQALDDLETYQNRLSEFEYWDERKDTLAVLGSVYVMQAQYAEALPNYQEAARIAEQLNDYQDQFDFLKMIIASHRNLGEYNQALELSQQMAAMVREKLPEDQQAESSSWLWLGMVQDDLGQHTAAIESYQKALSITKELNDVSSEISLLGNISIVYYNQGQYLQALTPVEQAVSLSQTAIQQLQNQGMAAVGPLCGEGAATLKVDGYQSCLSRYERTFGELLHTMATVYANLSRFSEAASAYEQALQIAEKYDAVDLQMRLLSSIGLLYGSQGKYSIALENLRRALQISLQTQNKPMQAVILNNIGSTYAEQGQYPKALEYCQNSLVLSREINAARSEAFALSCIASIYESQGRLADALAAYQQSLEIERNLDKSISITLNNIATIYSNQGRFDDALTYFEESLRIARETGNRRNEAATISNVAILYSEQADYSQSLTLNSQSLELRRQYGNPMDEIYGLTTAGGINLRIGQYAQALSSYEQALALSRSVGSLPEEAGALAGIAKTHLAQKQYAQALNFYQQALALVQQMGNIFFESRIQQAIGFIYLQQGNPAEASKLLEQALKAQREIGVRPDVGRTLNRLGLAYARQDKTEAAIDALQQAIAIHRDVGDRATEAEAFANLGQLSAQQNQPEVAVAFYKQAVNLTEQIRQGLQTLSRDQQESYTETISDRYRQLASLLLEQGKLLEAQQVLELLRIQDVRESTRGTVINLASGQIQLSPEEQRVGDSLDELIRFAAQLDQCERQTPPCPDRDRLLNQVDALTARYNRIVDQFESDATQARRAQDRNAPDPRSLLSEDVSRIVNAQPGTALLYPVVLEDKLLILWASSAGLALATEVPVERSKVNEAVLKFRSLMSQCELGGCQSEAAIREIQEVSQQLNQWLMPADLEAALKQANITNLVFALDYTLRYIPMSALYDGQQYLIEKDFTVSTVTAAWFNRVDNPLPADTSGISVLGLGLTAPVDLNLPEGEFRFNALNNVRPELNAIIRPETSSTRSTQGIYQGLELLDGQFDAAAFRQTLGRQVLHIATHGKFLPVNSSASFLVLGNQQPWRISEINNNLRYFQHLSLVVLSACETALGGSQRDFSGNQIPDGKEISGIAQTFLSAGVDTVIASLWLVNDPATRDLMQQFYSNLARSSPSNRVTISQALREAQLALLHGTQARTTSSATRSDIGTVVVEPSPDANVPRYAHPYYWSAFTIIGNGL